MYRSGSSEESRGLEIYILFIYISYSNKILWDSWRKYARTNTRLRPASEIKIFVIILEAAAELFLHLEVFVCRILVTVDLHIRNVPFLGRGCLIDLDEALRGNGKRQLSTICCQLTCQLAYHYNALLFFSDYTNFRLDYTLKYRTRLPHNDHWLMTG